MSFSREGIDEVRVVVLPDGIAPDGTAAAVSRTALVTWRSSQAGMFHQVYVDGRFAGSTIDAQQRQLVAHTPSSFRSAVRVEVLAVAAAEAHIDFTGRLESPAAGSGRVKLTLLRRQTLPAEAKANIYFDNGTGEIDYTQPLNTSPIPIWPCPQDKAGFGLARFGAGDFGYESAASVGFGKGSFGHGQLGLDADTLAWTTPVLPLGSYRFGVTIADGRGNESPACETEPIAVLPAAQPATGLRIAALDRRTNQLTLGICD
jgi:hypothetical protein